MKPIAVPSIAAALIVVAVTASAQVTRAVAQTGTNAYIPLFPPPPPPTLRTYLLNLHYDVTGRGALLVIAPDEPLDSDSGGANRDPVGHISIGGLAQRAGRDVVPIGSVTVLAPETMNVINDNPGKADPLYGMGPDQAIELLMGSLTPAQWRIACGESGIGFGDLNTDQKRLLDNILPVRMRVERGGWTEVVKDGKITAKAPEVLPIEDRTSIRLRLNRQVLYWMERSGTVDPQNGGEDSDREPNPSRLRMMNPDAYNSGETRTADKVVDPPTSAYGVPLLSVVPNRQKPSQIDYSSPRLNAPVSLGGLDKKSTLGDLVKRAGEATGMDIVPDRRVGDLSVYVRGNSVRAGDLLQAISLAVTGTYRRVGATSAYVLTSDIDGIGPRWARLEAWVAKTREEHDGRLEQAIQNAAKQNPLSYLTFAPSDSLILTPAQTQRLDDEYRQSGDFENEEMTVADLPPALAEKIARQAENVRRKRGIVLDPAKARVQMELSSWYIIPGLGEAFGMDLGTEDFAKLAHMPAKATPPVATSAPAAPDWSWLTAQDQKRVLIFAPNTIADAPKFVAEASRHGFSDVWLRLDGAKVNDERTLLEAAIAAGKRHHIAITAEVSLLRSPRTGEDFERNLEGQTGEEFVVAYLKQQTATGDTSGGLSALERELERHYSGWRSADASEIARRIGELADAPGLGGLAFRDSAPPGFLPRDDSGDAPILPGGELGYTDDRRSAFLHATGFDPIDLRDSGAGLIPPAITLPFFPYDDEVLHHTYQNDQAVWDAPFRSPQRLWDDFRQTENKRLMRSLYERLRTIRPTLPLWISSCPTVIVRLVG